ncbi:MAG: molybdopterin-dependent oxidoreductase [Myxococcota bacterium]
MAARWFHRSCPICEASCALRVEADVEARRVLRIEGDADDPISRGHLCPKAFALRGVHEDPDRLRRPIVRDRASGAWREVGWDEAIDTAVRGLRDVQQAHGADALAVYIGNPSGFDVGSMLYNGFVLGSLGTRRMFSAATMDHFPKLFTSRVMLGKGSLLPIPDVDRCDYFLCLGGNPVVSQGSLMSAPGIRSRLRALRARGGRFVVVDPRRTESAREADEHLFIRPGTDACWLFAVAHVLFAEGLVKTGRLGAFVDGIERVRELARDFAPEDVADATGIDAATTRRIARELAAHPRACVYGRIGTCTVEFGTLASWLVDVVNVLLGRYDEPGGMMFPRPATGQHEPGRALPELAVGDVRTVVRGLPAIEGQLPASAFAEELDPSLAGERRIRALVTVAGNPVLSLPAGDAVDRGLAGLDFMVAVDPYLNETTRHADVVLPTLPQLEHDNYDFLAQSTTVRNFARYSEQVFPPEPGGKRSWEVFLALAARWNGAEPEAFDDAMLLANATRFAGRLGLDPERVVETLAKEGERGPMRLVDLQLRCGPYGDRFGADPDGLTLAKLRAARRAVDLGALEPRLPDVLRTPGRRIALADARITADVARLRERLPSLAAREGLVLVGRRQARGMNSWLHNVESLAAGRPRCTLRMHPDDARARGLAEGALARIRSRVGEVVAPLEISQEMMPGVVSLPHGFGHAPPGGGTRTRVASARQPGVNANALTDPEPLDAPSGTAVANGIPVEVEAA